MEQIETTALADRILAFFEWLPIKTTITNVVFKNSYNWSSYIERDTLVLRYYHKHACNPVALDYLLLTHIYRDLLLMLRERDNQWLSFPQELRQRMAASEAEVTIAQFYKEMERCSFHGFLYIQQEYRKTDIFGSRMENEFAKFLGQIISCYLFYTFDTKTTIVPFKPIYNFSETIDFIVGIRAPKIVTVNFSKELYYLAHTTCSAILPSHLFISNAIVICEKLIDIFANESNSTYIQFVDELEEFNTT